MPAKRLSKTCRVFIGRHVRKHRKEGMPRDQAVAVAYQEARERGCKIPPRNPRRHAVKEGHEGTCCMCGGSHCCCGCPMG